VGVVTQGSLDPVLEVSRAAKRVPVNRIVSPELLPVRSKVILPISGKEFRVVVGNSVLEVKDDY